MKTLKIGIASYQDMKARTIAIALGDLKPRPGDPKVWFTSTESFAKVLSNKNRALLATIVATHPGSLQELAGQTGRKASNLSRTLKTMEQLRLRAASPWGTRTDPAGSSVSVDLSGAAVERLVSLTRRRYPPIEVRPEDRLSNIRALKQAQTGQGCDSFDRLLTNARTDLGGVLERLATRRLEPVPGPYGSTLRSPPTRSKSRSKLVIEVSPYTATTAACSASRAINPRHSSISSRAASMTSSVTASTSGNKIRAVS